MTVEWLIGKLKEANPRDEVIVTVTDVGTGEVLGGILSSVIMDGGGAARGKFEIYAKG